MTPTRWLLLLFLTLGMPGYAATTATVTDVRHGVVTMVTAEGEEHRIEEDEAWRAGDRAEVIVSKQGIVEARYRR